MGFVEGWLIFWMIFGIEGSFRVVERAGEWATGQDMFTLGIAAIDDPWWDGKTEDPKPPTVE
jgi:hypothetical protein